MTQSELLVADKTVVSLDYTLKLDDGEVLEQSQPGSPLVFLPGVGMIIPGLEKALYGLKVGEEKSVTVSPEEGYGEIDPDSLEEMSRTEFPEDLDLELGLPLSFRDAETDEALEGIVSEIESDRVVIDFNHPLAGQTLFFDVKIASLRAATADELAHGHVHLN